MMAPSRTIPAVCRSHQPHRSRAEAQRAADLHPIFCRRGCPKCEAGQPFRPFRCDENPAHWHNGHGFPVDLQEVVAMPVQHVPVVAPTAPARRSTKLSAEQCCEIARLYHVEHLNPRVIAARFDVVPQTVHEVAKGRTYLWATRELLATLGMVVAPTTTKHKPRQQEQEVITVQTTATATDRLIVPPGESAPDPMLGDLADALELLLSYRERPLPRFVSVPAIRDLLAQARQKAG